MKVGTKTLGRVEHNGSRTTEQLELIILELQEALARVRTLSGLLRVCAHCRRICDEGGDWKRFEAYLSQRTEAEFTHGCCPECSSKILRQLRRRRTARVSKVTLSK